MSEIRCSNRSSSPISKHCAESRTNLQGNRFCDRYEYQGPHCASVSRFRSHQIPLVLPNSAGQDTSPWAWLSNTLQADYSVSWYHDLRSEPAAFTAFTVSPFTYIQGASQGKQSRSTSAFGNRVTARTTGGEPISGGSGSAAI